MTQPDRLTIEQVEKFAEISGQCLIGDVARQLADTMRENERLRSIIESCECGAGEAIADNPYKESE
jgi:hypothetical protein